MSNYDELIKKAQREIEKLTAGIEKSKARIAELRTNIKEYEAQKSNDLQFSDNLLELMNSNPKYMIKYLKQLISCVSDVLSDQTSRMRINKNRETAALLRFL